MTDIGEAFVLLDSGPRPHGGQVATRRVSETSGDIRVGVDSEGFRHLLIPTEEGVPTDTTSASLRLVPRHLDVEGQTVQFADLRCTDSRLSLVFERLVSDVIGRIEGGATPRAALSKALSDWRDLFRSGSQGISADEVAGLIGELELLKRLASVAGHVPALDAWWGPEGHTHDFYAASGQAIEVKATRALDGGRIHVSNINQLDPADVTDLHLVVFRLKADRLEPTLDERITALLNSGFPAADLLTKVERAGHVHESPIAFNTRFKVLSDNWWRVDDHFPGLRASRVTDPALRGVSNIKYQLSVDAASASISDVDVAQLLSNWGNRD